MTEDGLRGVVGEQGYFGDHSKGVYVSRHADYTFYYANHRCGLAVAGVP